MTRARPITALAAVLAATTGCPSHVSSYHPARSAAGELVWAYRERFQVTRDSEILAEQHDWDALPGAVTCVPRARDWAAWAAERDRTGKILTWSGLGTIVGSVIAGGVVIFSGHDHDRSDLVGAGIALGGLVTGLTIAIAGGVTRSHADAAAIDAVNLYNDERARCAAPR